VLGCGEEKVTLERKGLMEICQAEVEHQERLRRCMADGAILLRSALVLPLSLVCSQ